MTPSANISNLSEGSRAPATAGLSIVVPAYNEAAGLARLHERLCALGQTLRRKYGLACEVSTWMTARLTRP